MPDVILGEFSTDVTPPEVTNPSPVNGAQFVARDADVEFDITDLEAGVDTASVEVSVGGVIVFTGGAFATPTYDGTFTDMGGGTWHFALTTHPDLASYTTINVTVDGQDLAPLANVMAQYAWSFTTEDYEAPYVDVGYAPTGAGVAISALITFDLKDDGAGVDLGTVNVTVGGVPAFVSGKFQTGFDGPSSAIDESLAPNVYGFTIDASPDYGEYTTYEVAVDASGLRQAPEPIGPAAIFAWRMNEIGPPSEYRDYAINNKPLVSNVTPSPLVTDPGFGPFNNVRRPTGDILETAWFDGVDVTWPADKVWISWWMRPINLLNWSGGTNQPICDVLAAVNSPPYTSFQLRKDGSQIEYRFYTSLGSSGFRNFTLTGLDPTKWHLFGLFLDGATGDYGLFYNLTQVHTFNIGGPCTLGHGQPGASDLRLRNTQDVCDIFELFVENRIFTPTEWANKFARYPQA
jgi:hypothetical protein